jgi:hypothetical protein
VSRVCFHYGDPLLTHIAGVFGPLECSATYIQYRSTRPSSEKAERSTQPYRLPVSSNNDRGLRPGGLQRSQRFIHQVPAIRQDS